MADVRRFLLMSSLSAGLMAAGCLGPGNEPPDGGAQAGDTPMPSGEEPDGPVEVTFHPFTELKGFGSSSALMEPERFVIRDTEAWAELWSRIFSSVHPQPELPPVDFSREKLIIATMGFCPSSGYSISIESVRRSGRALYVSVLEVSPGDMCLVADVETLPVAAIRVPAGDEAVQFHESTDVLDCSEEAP